VIWYAKDLGHSNLVVAQAQIKVSVSPDKNRHTSGWSSPLANGLGVWGAPSKIFLAYLQGYIGSNVTIT